MKFQVVALMAALLVGCGSAQDQEALNSEVASLSSTNLRVECFKSIEARDVVLRDRLTLIVQGKSVKLTRLRTEKRADRSFSISDALTGSNNTIYDGAVVKKTHVRMLLTPAEHVKNNNGQSTSAQLRHALIEYSQGKVKVTDPDTKILLSHENCRTASF